MRGTHLVPIHALRNNSSNAANKSSIVLENQISGAWNNFEIAFERWSFGRILIVSMTLSWFWPGGSLPPNAPSPLPSFLVTTDPL